jgi:DNA polymerase-4
MEYPINLQFNPKQPTVMHIDLNSCFATIEQQANPLLRGKPIAVAAYKSPGGCILAPSIEAKRFGIKTGMRVKDGKMLYQDLIVLEPDPWKYRNVHLSLRKILETYTNNVIPKSIDEFVLDLEGFPAMRKGLINVGNEIKQRINSEVGDWLRVSIGIAPNRYLAKTAAGIKKPDGLEIIDINNFLAVYESLELNSLCGIKTNNITRLNKMGIFTVRHFYESNPKIIQMAFHSVMGYRWFLRLRGWEIDDVEFTRKSYGNSVALKERLVTPEELAPVLMNLVEKMSRRMRSAGYKARGVHLSLLYRDGNHWHKGSTKGTNLFAPGDIYKVAYKILLKSPYRIPVHTIAVSCFNLVTDTNRQLSILELPCRKENLTDAVDRLTAKWGNFVITPARILATKDVVKDRVAFGGIKELEEFVLKV